MPTPVSYEQLKNAALTAHSLIVRDIRERDNAGLNIDELNCKAWWLQQAALLVQGAIDEETTLTDTDFYCIVELIYDVAGLDYSQVTEEVNIAHLLFTQNLGNFILNVVNTINNPGGPDMAIQSNDGAGGFHGDGQYLFHRSEQAVTLGTRNAGTVGRLSFSIGDAMLVSGSAALAVGEGISQQSDNALAAGRNLTVATSQYSLVVGDGSVVTGSANAGIIGDNHNITNAPGAFVAGSGNTVDAIDTYAISKDAEVHAAGAAIVGGNASIVQAGATNAIVLGLDSYTATVADYTYVDNLAIVTQPAAGTTTMLTLVWDTATKQVRSVATLTGSGTEDYIVKFGTAGTSIGDSVLFEDTVNDYISLGDAIPASRFSVKQSADTNVGGISLVASGSVDRAYIYRQAGGSGNLIIGNQGTDGLYLASAWVGVGTIPTHSLHVSGAIRMEDGTGETATDGTMRWNPGANDFEGYANAMWNTFTGGEANAVDSVFGRTGAVVAVSGDYSHTQITDNEPEKHRVINDGSTSNIELWSGSYLDSIFVYRAGDTMTGKLQFSGTTHAGIELISLTTTERNALTPIAGDTIWNETTINPETYTGSVWTSLFGAGGGLNNIVEDVTPQLGASLDMNGFALVDTALDIYLDFLSDTTPVNYLILGNADTAVAPFFQAAGTDTDIDINFIPKGTGHLQENGTDVALVGHVHAAADITSGTFDDARVSLSNVSQHGDTRYHRTSQDVTIGAFFIDVDDIAVPANPGVGVRRIFTDTGSGELSVRTNAGVTVSLETSTASVLTTKGDILTYTTGDARLPVGTDGQFIVADSVQSEGIKWDDFSTYGWLVDANTTLLAEVEVSRADANDSVVMDFNVNSFVITHTDILNAGEGKITVDGTAVILSVKEEGVANYNLLTMNETGQTVITDAITSKGWEYAADYSANFSDRSLIDKGFADGEYIFANATTTSTGFTINASNSITINATTFSNITIDSTAVTTIEGVTTIIQTNGGANALEMNGSGGQITLDTNDTFIFAADYTADFVARSLIDKGYADTNYWNLTGTSNIVTSATIVLGAGESIDMGDSGTSGIPQLLLDASANSAQMRIWTSTTNYTYLDLTGTVATIARTDTSAFDVLIGRIQPPSSGNMYDSGRLVIRGTAHDGTPRNADFILQTNVTATDGTAQLEFTSSLGTQQFKLLDDNTVASPDILPILDDTHDLGSATLRWKDIYYSGTSNYGYAIDRVTQGISNSPSSVFRATTQEADTTDHNVLYRLIATPGDEAMAESDLTIAGNIDGGGYNDIFSFNNIDGAHYAVDYSGTQTAGDRWIPDKGFLDATYAPISVGGDMILAGVQTVTGAKTFEDGTMLLRNVADSFNGVFSNTNTADRTYTLFDSSDTLVGKATTDVLTNKTLDADGTGNVITNIGSSEVKSELITGLATVTPATGDFVMISDTGDGGNLKKVDVLDFGGGIGGTIADGQVAFGVGTNIGGDADFIWDSTNNQLGIGAAIPIYALDIRIDSDISGNIIGLTNVGTQGTTIKMTSTGSPSGFDLTQTSTGAVVLQNKENAEMSFYTNNVERLVIPAGGIGAGGADDVLTWDSTSHELGWVTQASLGGGSGTIGGSIAADSRIAFGNGTLDEITDDVNMYFDGTGLVVHTENAFEVGMRVHDNSGTSTAIIQLTNATTGTGSFAGFAMELLGNESVLLNNRETTAMHFAIAGTARFGIESTGRARLITVPTTEASFSTAEMVVRDATSGYMNTIAASGGGTTNFLRADGTWADPGSGFASDGAVNTIQLSDGSSGFTSFTGMTMAATGITINSATSAFHILDRNAVSNTAQLLYYTAGSSKWAVGPAASTENFSLYNAGTPATDAFTINATTNEITFNANVGGGVATEFLNAAGGWTVPAGAAGDFWKTAVDTAVTADIEIVGDGSEQIVIRSEDALGTTYSQLYTEGGVRSRMSYITPTTTSHFTSTSAVALMTFISGANDVWVQASATGISVRDEASTSGMHYDADYSTDGILDWGDRWIIDRGYADTTYINDAAETVALSNMAQISGMTLLGRNIAGSASPTEFTIGLTTEEAAPAAGDWILGETAGGVMVRYDVGNLPGSAGFWGLAGTSSLTADTVIDLANFDLNILSRPGAPPSQQHGVQITNTSVALYSAGATPASGRYFESNATGISSGFFENLATWAATSGILVWDDTSKKVQEMDNTVAPFWHTASDTSTTGVRTIKMSADGDAIILTKDKPDFVTDFLAAPELELNSTGEKANLKMWDGVASFPSYIVGIDGAAIKLGSLNTGTGAFLHGLEITTAGQTFQGLEPVNYSGDVSGNYVARSLIDKGYADATYGGGAFWATSGTTNLVGAGATIQLGGISDALNLTDHIASSGFFITAAGSAIEGAVSHGGADGAWIYDPNNVLVQGAGIYFIDYRVGAAAVGMEYIADYTANFTTRSLIDKGYADANYASGTVSGTGTDNQVALWNGTNDIDALAAGTNTHVLTMVAGVPAWAAPTGGGSGAFTADVDTQITPTAAILLDHATNNEIAFDLSGTVNKAAGTSNWIFANVTTTTALDNFIDLQNDSISVFSIDNTGSLRMGDADGPALLNEAASSSNPTLIPAKSNPTTGIGESSGNIWLISAGVAKASIGASLANFYVDAKGSNASSWRLEVGAATATVPTVVPNSASTNTGIGGVTGSISLITGGVEAINIDGSQNIATVGTYTSSVAGGASSVGDMLTLTGTGQPNTRTLKFGVENLHTYIDHAQSAGNLEFRYNGVEIMRLNGTQLVLGPNGTAADPSIHWTGDADTGFFYGPTPGNMATTVAGVLSQHWAVNDTFLYEDDGTTVLAQFERDTGNIALLGASPTSYGTTAASVMYINDGTAPTGDPTTGGGDLFSDAGVLKWRSVASGLVDLTAGGSASPGGSDSHVQYNNSTAFGGEANFIYNDTTKLVTISKDDSGDGTVYDALKLSHTDSGTPADGKGTSLLFEVDTSTAGLITMDFEVTAYSSTSLGLDIYNGSNHFIHFVDTSTTRIYAIGDATAKHSDISTGDHVVAIGFEAGLGTGKTDVASGGVFIGEGAGKTSGNHPSGASDGVHIGNWGTAFSTAIGLDSISLAGGGPTGSNFDVSGQSAIVIAPILGKATATGAQAYGRGSGASAQGSIMMGYHTSLQTNSVSDTFELSWDGTRAFKTGPLFGTQVTNNADPDTNLTASEAGSLAWDTTSDEIRVYNGTGWENVLTWDGSILKQTAGNLTLGDSAITGNVILSPGSTNRSYAIGTLGGFVVSTATSGANSVRITATATNSSIFALAGTVVDTFDISGAAGISGDTTGGNLILAGGAGWNTGITNGGDAIMKGGSPNSTGAGGSVLLQQEDATVLLEVDDTGLGFFGATPVAQPTHIADATGGSTVDTEARAAINSLLSQVAALGLQAAS